MSSAVELPAPGTAAVLAHPAAHALAAVAVIARRDVERQLRRPGVLASQLVQIGFFVLVYAIGIGGMVPQVDGVPFAAYAFPGIVLLQVVTVGVSSGLTYAWDRDFGVLREMLVAPVPRICLPAGKALGAVTVITAQSAAIVALGPLLGLRLTATSYLLAVACCAATAGVFSLLGLYLAMAISRVETLQAAIQLAMYPLLFLSGSVFAIDSAPSWLRADDAESDDLRRRAAALGRARTACEGARLGVRRRSTWRCWQRCCCSRRPASGGGSGADAPTAMTVAPSAELASPLSSRLATACARLEDDRGAHPSVPSWKPLQPLPAAAGEDEPPRIADRAIGWLDAHLAWFHPDRWEQHLPRRQFPGSPMLELLICRELHDQRPGTHAAFVDRAVELAQRVVSRVDVAEGLHRTPQLFTYHAWLIILLERLCGTATGLRPVVEAQLAAGRTGIPSAAAAAVRALELRHVLDLGAIVSDLPSTSELLRRWWSEHTRNPLAVADGDAYALTHAVFYATDFGRRPAASRSPPTASSSIGPS